MSIIIVHGIHTDGGSVKAFGQDLESRGHAVRYFHYPRRWAISQYFPWVPKNDGSALANFMENGDHVVAHSNGGLVWQNSIKAGSKWGQCFIFGAAATSDKMVYPPDCLKKAHIIYNPKDKALMSGALLPFHPYGSLGLGGYQGEKDNRFINVQGFNKGLGLNHSHYFSEQKEKWLNYIENAVQ